MSSYSNADGGVQHCVSRSRRLWVLSKNALISRLPMLRGRLESWRESHLRPGSEGVGADCAMRGNLHCVATYKYS